MSDSIELPPPQNRRQFSDLKFYKPRPNGQGAASRWNLARDKQAVFVEMANQMPSDDENARFDWDRHLTVKLGLPDLGEILAVLLGRKAGVGTKRGEGRFSGLFHKNPKGDSSLGFVRAANSEGFYLKVGVKREGGDLKTAGHSFTEGEACVLRIALETAVARLVGWSEEKTRNGAT